MGQAKEVPHYMYFLLFVLVVCMTFVADVASDSEEAQPNTHNAGRAASDVDISSKSHVWGPGLFAASSTTPVRYFYVHAVDEATGLNLTASPGKDKIDIQYGDGSNNDVRIRSEMFDRGDGSFIIRYRLYKSFPTLSIRVLSHDGKHLGASPFNLERVHDESCFCPAPLDSFKEDYKCPADGFNQIDEDLAQFGDVNLTATIPESISRFSDGGGACFAHYSIIDNRLYAKVHGPHTGFRMFSDAFLSSLVRKVKLPDVEFIVNLGDYPQERRLTAANKLPVFSWCGSTEHADIVMPTYDVTEAVVNSMSRLHRDMISSQSRGETPVWSHKTAKAFWRGRDSRDERLKLVRLSRQHPDLIDAQLTNYFFFRDKEEELGRGKYVSFPKFFDYKYQVNLDGTVAAYRFPWLMAGGSAILKQESTYYEHFYSQLEPWKHYVPVKRDLSDLVKQINWLRRNEDKAEEIARNAVEFTHEHLMPERIYCYYAMLFEQYAAKLTTMPTKREGMEEVESPPSRCDCHHTAQTTSETQGSRDEL